MSQPRNQIEKFAEAVQAAQLNSFAINLLVDLASLEAGDRSLAGLTNKREWKKQPVLEALSRLEEARFVEGTNSNIQINWKALGLDLLECSTSSGKPVSAVLTLQTAFRRLQQPPSAVKTPALKSDLAAFRQICRFLTKNGLENRSEMMVKQYFLQTQLVSGKSGSPSGFLSWLKFKFR